MFGAWPMVYTNKQKAQQTTRAIREDAQLTGKQARFNGDTAEEARKQPRGLPALDSHSIHTWRVTNLSGCTT